MKLLWHFLCVCTLVTLFYFTSPWAFVLRRVLYVSSVQVKELLNCFVRRYLSSSTEGIPCIPLKDSLPRLPVLGLSPYLTCLSGCALAYGCSSLPWKCPLLLELSQWLLLSARSCWWTAVGAHHVNELNASWRFFTCHWAPQTCYSLYSSSPLFLVLLPTPLIHSSTTFLDKEESLNLDITCFAVASTADFKCSGR